MSDYNLSRITIRTQIIIRFEVQSGLDFLLEVELLLDPKLQLKF